jgi:hypothetical protein
MDVMVVMTMMRTGGGGGEGTADYEKVYFMHMTLIQGGF